MTTDPFVRCRFMESADVPRVVELMGQGPLALRGVSSTRLHRALCRSALRDPRVRITVAECEGTVAGYRLTALDWKRAQRAFAMRYPLLACAMLMKRLRGRRKSGGVWDQLTPEQRRIILDVVEPEPSGRSWRDNSPRIAKGLFIHVDPRFRRRGIAAALYDHTLCWLIDQGIPRIDACAALTNVRVLPLHKRMGYRIEMADGYLFATTDLVKDAVSVEAVCAIENRV